MKDGDSFAHTFTTKLLNAPDDDHGMRGECSCLRHQQGILCDHLYSHLVAVGGYNVVDFVHERDTMEYYVKQYPIFGAGALRFLKPEYNHVRPYKKQILMPVVPCVRRGRPKKGRFIGNRERKIKAYIAKEKVKNRIKAYKRKCK